MQDCPQRHVPQVSRPPSQIPLCRWEKGCGPAPSSCRGQFRTGSKAHSRRPPRLSTAGAGCRAPAAFHAIQDIAKADKFKPSHVSRVERMRLLAPQIVEAILTGYQPAGLTRATAMQPLPAECRPQPSLRPSHPQCEACKKATASLLPTDFQPIDLVYRRKMTDPTPPDRLSVDPSSTFYDAAELERGIHVFLDGKEYFNVEEYCKTEGWVRLPAGKARTRSGRPVTITKHGDVTIRYEDI